MPCAIQVRPIVVAISATRRSFFSEVRANTTTSASAAGTATSRTAGQSMRARRSRTSVSRESVVMGTIEAPHRDHGDPGSPLGERGGPTTAPFVCSDRAADAGPRHGERPAHAHDDPRVGAGQLAENLLHDA